MIYPIENITSQGNTTTLTDVNEELRECDGCGACGPDVDLWAENDETGEELWLCVSCGDW